MEILSTYIAPWNLARESIPIHIIWSQDPSIDSVKLSIPSDFIIEELLNVKKYTKISDNEIIIKEINRVADAPNYFAMLLCVPKPYSIPLIKKVIKATFLSNNIPKKVVELEAKIVRPIIQLINPPTEVYIDDHTNPNKLFNLTIKHTGLGKTEIHLKATRAGQLISESDSLYFILLKEILNDIINPGERDENQKKAEDVEINEEWLRQTTNEIMDRLSQGELPSEYTLDLEDWSEWLKNPINRQKLLDLLYFRIKRLAISSVLYYLDMSPHEDIYLPYGRTKTVFKSEMTNITIVIEYTDSLENKYDHIKVNIPVTDNRSNKHKVFEAPINIRWISEGFKIE